MTDDGRPIHEGTTKIHEGHDPAHTAGQAFTKDL